MQETRVCALSQNCNHDLSTALTKCSGRQYADIVGGKKHVATECNTGFFPFPIMIVVCFVDDTVQPGHTATSTSNEFPFNSICIRGVN